MSTITMRTGPTNQERDFVLETEPPTPATDGRIIFTLKTRREEQVRAVLTVHEADQLMGVIDAALRAARRKR
jgi:hypothetical protein